MNALKYRKIIILTGFSLLMIWGCKKENYKIQSGDLLIEFNSSMYSRVNSEAEGANPLTDDFRLSEYLVTKNFSTDKFSVYDRSDEPIENQFGKGNKTILKGRFRKDGVSLDKIIGISTFDQFPGIAMCNVEYINSGEQDIEVRSWKNHSYSILPGNEVPNLWSFQGSSSGERADWIMPLTPGYYKKNYMGMNDSDYGGGIPVTDLWRKDCGIAVGHTELYPQEVSLPVDFDKYAKRAQIGIEKEYSDFLTFNRGDTLKTMNTFVLVHKGDYFAGLRQFAKIMAKKGIVPAPAEPEAFEPVWCGWGYMRNFTMAEILGTLPKVKELGIKWAVIDDGYQVAEGDWRVDTKRFSGGSADMRKMVDAIHAQGLKAKLWWAPLAADPGSQVLKDHPEALLINAKGAPEYISWWDSYYLSPAKKSTISYTKETVEMFLKDWGFDGLKMDGQHMNAVPPDYSWDSPLEYPGKSVESLPGFFKTVFELARQIKPHAVIENCPCGCCMSFYNMPWANQFVASDPTSSWQIRLKGKTYKALMPRTAYYGDHVELSDGGDDFASSFGVGAVLGTKFTWPADNPSVNESYLLTPDKEIRWKKWFTLYNNRMLSKGEYLGTLYDIGYDIPETHVIRTGDALNYAFYNKNWDGGINLRGLEKRKYRVTDYFNGRDLGTVEGPSALLNISFKDFMLIEAVPEPN